MTSNGRPLQATTSRSMHAATFISSATHSPHSSHPAPATLTPFIAQPDPSEFLRVDRSHVVRISFITEMRPLFHGDSELVLRDGQTLSLSRRYKALLPPAIRERL